MANIIEIISPFCVLDEGEGLFQGYMSGEWERDWSLVIKGVKTYPIHHYSSR